MSAIVETFNLTKRYGQVTAVRNMNLVVQEGEIYGFLGPNGSGKTTTILMLLGLTEPSLGRATVGGFDSLEEPIKVKRIVGYLPENVGFYPDLNAWDNLRYTASLNGIPRKEADKRIGELISQVHLDDAAGRGVGTYSRGMRQRLGIADLLVKQPKVVFLDDPTIGLDPEGIQELLGMVVDMSRKQGITVFLSSHQLQQVQRICDRVGIMFKGEMVAEGSVEQLAKNFSRVKPRLEAQVQNVSPALVDAVKEVKGAEDVVVTGDWIALSCDPAARPEVARVILEKGGKLVQLRAAEDSLEDIYMRYFHRAEAQSA
jgi:ABC-2 type transport system ATP-binding protein